MILLVKSRIARANEFTTLRCAGVIWLLFFIGVSICLIGVWFVGDPKTGTPYGHMINKGLDYVFKSY